MASPGTEDKKQGALSDAELVRGALLRSDDFGRIIEKYQEPLRRYIRRIASPSPDELEILLQDIFIKTYENLNDFEQDLPFSSWIYRIAHNESIDSLRRKRRFGGSLDDVSDDEDAVAFVETIAADTDIVGDIDKEYAKKNILRVLDLLPAKYRSVLILKFLEEKDYEEISDILKKPPGTVATLIHRAKRDFRKIAAEKGMDIKNI